MAEDGEIPRPPFGQAASATRRMTMEELTTASVRELKGLLSAAGIDIRDCIERADLVRKAKDNDLVRVEIISSDDDRSDVDGGDGGRGDLAAGATPSSAPRTVPRYFDPESEWEQNTKRCYRCGRAGHLMRDCTYEEKQKPCYLCGALDHQARGQADCPNTLCYRCGKPGHQARDCHNPTAVHHVCLRCGSRQCANSGSPTFSRELCSFEYHPKDLALVTFVGTGASDEVDAGRGAKRRKIRGAPPPFENVRGGVSCAVCGEDGHHHSETWLCRWGRGGRNQHGGGGGGFLDSARRMERQPRRHSEPARPYSGRGPPPPPPGDRRWQSPPGPHYHNPLFW